MARQRGDRTAQPRQQEVSQPLTELLVACPDIPYWKVKVNGDSVQCWWCLDRVSVYHSDGVYVVCDSCYEADFCSIRPSLHGFCDNESYINQPRGRGWHQMYFGGNYGK